MRIRGFLPTKKSIDTPRFFDSYAQAYFHQGDETGCAVIHGFTGTPANVRIVADRLSEAGFTVYTPLLSGHGTTLRDMDSMTEKHWLNDARLAYDRLAAAGCRRIYMLGFSMGGLLASIVAAERKVSGLVLINAPFIMRRYLYTVARISPILPFVVYDGDRLRRETSRQGYAGTPLRKLEDLERLALKARGSLYKVRCPTLILQSARDKRVDMASVLVGKLGIGSKDVECIRLENSTHGCTVGPERDLVANYCRDFVIRIEKRIERRDTDG